MNQISLYHSTTIYILFIIYNKHTKLKILFINKFFHSIPFLSYKKKKNNYQIFNKILPKNL